jgi:hypothetical protein
MSGDKPMGVFSPKFWTRVQLKITDSWLSGCECTIRYFEFMRAAARSTTQIRTQVPDPPKGL